MASSSAAITDDSGNNSEHLGDGDGDDAVHVNTRKLFRIDTSKIESVPHSQQNAELQHLDLHVYNQDIFEQGYMIFAFLSSLPKMLCFYLG